MENKLSKMQENIEQIKKYILLLVGAYIAVRLIAFTLIFLNKDILLRHISEFSTRLYSPDDLILPFQYLSYLIIAFVMYQDMMKTGLLNIPVLFLTFFSGVYGVVFYLILFFAKTTINPQQKYGNN